MKSALKAWLVAACAIAGAGCTSGDKTQVLTGRLTNRSAVAVRAIDGDTIVTAARVRSDGSFTLLLPAHHRYRLEVLTESGVHNIVGTKNGTISDLSFKVCEPEDPFDMGGMTEPGCDPMTDPNCGGGTWPCDANDPDCKPWPCDPMTDPNCGQCDPSDPTCGTCDPMTDPNCGGGCDPMADPNCDGQCDNTMNDPDCYPPPCDPMNDPNCMMPPCDPSTDIWCGEPPPCNPMTDPNCGQCDPNDPTCGICPDGTEDPNCKCNWFMGTDCEPIPPCDPNVDLMCPMPPPPCEDPTDPNTCKDPCVDDPMLCGCGVSPGDPGDGTTMDPVDGMGTPETTCWPEPEPCNAMSCPDDPVEPQYPPGDFGCGDDDNGGGTTDPGDGNTMGGVDFGKE
jgi:hypothetical protein